MACLEKLQIQGIRSFDPNKPEQLAFYPLTIILGSNGAGKTTLIECLRFAATADFPPQTNRGKTWIHDINCTKSHTVKSQVRLKFRDKDNVGSTISRSLELTAKRERSGKIIPQMRTLDATIKRGEEHIVSSKCAEVDSVMLDLLGVSKSVLSDVIFCHQEDSNWPLSESKILKEKFDQLFGSTGYVKALKRIKDDRAEFLNKHNACQGYLKLFEEQKDQQQSYTSELERNETELQVLKNKVNCLTQELAPITKELGEHRQREERILKMEEDISLLKGQADGVRTIITSVEGEISEVFQGSEEELNTEIAKFSENLEEKRKTRTTIDDEIIKIDEKIRDLNSGINQLSIKKGKWESKQGKYKDDVKKLRNCIEHYFPDLDIDPINHLMKLREDVVSSIPSIKETLIINGDKIHAEIEEMEKSHNASIEQVEEELDQLKKEINCIDQSKKMHEESLKESERELNEITSKLFSICTSAASLDSLSQEINRLKDKISQKEARFDLNGTQALIDSLTSKIQSNHKNLEQLRSKKDSLQEKSEILAVTKVHQSNRNKAQEIVSEIIDKHSHLLEELGISVSNPEHSFFDELCNRMSKIQRRLKSKEEDREIFLSEKRTVESHLSVERTKLKDLKKDMKEKEGKIRSACGSESFQDVLQKVEQSLKDLRSKSSNSTGAQSLLNEFSQTISEKMKCPVCNKDLCNSQEREKLLSELDERITGLPVEAELVIKELEEKQLFYERLISLKSEHEFLKTCKDEIDKFSQSLSNHEKDLKAIEQKEDSLMREMRKEKALFEKFRSAEQDALSFDSQVKIINECDRAIRKVENDPEVNENDVNGANDSVEDLKEEIQKLYYLVEEERFELEAVQKRKEEFSSELGKLKQTLLDKEKEKLQLEKNQQSQVALRSKSDELTKRISDKSQMIEDLTTKKMRIQPRLENTREKRKELGKKQNKERDLLDEKKSLIKSVKDDFDHITADIMSYEREDVESKAQEIEEKILQNKQKIESCSSKRKELIREHQNLSKELNQVELVKRNLTDNRQLLEKSRKLKTLQDELAKREKERDKERGGLSLNGFLRKRQELEKRVMEENQSLQQAKGQQEPIVKRIRELKDKLKEEKYAKAKENHSKKLLEFLEIESICEDLNKLYKALDHSVLVFHHRKMEEINRYLYRLWNYAYRGNDIDYIKIVADQEGGYASDKKRSFNYKVVMVRQNLEMDMRGRCSAGQKVIASLVMRLALAEIFSVNCGILTLDEPTTNLDKDNIQAFADAVVNIVKSHQNRKFQLIIITHDDEFLKCLRDSDCEFYYHIQKDEKGYSRIEKLSIKDRE
ncbi:DNA repair protein rad50 [Brevipalpus obovatus]|uniref:DNA repair protein rad50 n=1 Tax=Brevipalpus obovatus TaxID=246614 RepID=UPI003D9E350A